MDSALIPHVVHEAAEREGLGESIWIDRSTLLPYTRAWCYLWEHGVIHARGWRGRLLSVRRLRRWRDVVELRWSRRVTATGSAGIGSVVTRVTDTFTARFDDGYSLRFYIAEGPDMTLATEYEANGRRSDTSTVNESARAACRILRDAVASARLVSVRAALERGERVGFGTLSASTEGLEVGGHTYPWADIRTPRVDLPLPRTFELRAQGRVRTEATLELRVHDEEGRWMRYDYPLPEIANVGTLRLLHEQMGSEQAGTAPEASHE